MSVVKVTQTHRGHVTVQKGGENTKTLIEAKTPHIEVEEKGQQGNPGPPGSSLIIGALPILP